MPRGLASSFLTKAQSSRRISRRTPCPAIHCSFAAVMSSSGYSYFGSLFLPRLASMSHTGSSASCSSGHDSATMSPPMFVTKPVRTTAPFSYVTFASARMCVRRVVSAPLKQVSDGANRKNGMPRSR